MSKPIEPGCRAVVTDGNGKGEIITVGEFIGSHARLYGRSDYWSVPSLGQYIAERDMKRIDDYDGDTKTTWDALKDIWNPKRESA